MHFTFIKPSRTTEINFNKTHSWRLMHRRTQETNINSKTVLYTAQRNIATIISTKHNIIIIIIIMIAPEKVNCLSNVAECERWQYVLCGVDFSAIPKQSWSVNLMPDLISICFRFKKSYVCLSQCPQHTCCTCYLWVLAKFAIACFENDLVS